MVIGCTTHNIFMNSIIIYDSPDMFPNMKKCIISYRLCMFAIWIVFRVTKLYKVTKFSRVLNMGIVQECSDRVPHCM